MAEPTDDQFQDKEVQKTAAQLDAERVAEIQANRDKEIDNLKVPTGETKSNGQPVLRDASDEEKEVLRLYDQGMQTFAIAKKVYKFVNADTVGTVILICRREHADDFQEVEDIRSTRGYTGL